MNFRSYNPWPARCPGRNAVKFNADSGRPDAMEEGAGIRSSAAPNLAKGEKRKLKLIDSRPLSTGIVILRYVPVAEK